ncbi:aminopeptidase N [Flaviflexus salsibiostraticola]|uniref:Aminopeptidase N n=1 Tax=Flaviflexus salsibiostraticola TaxID=1282737 RepID=A0A3S8Z740_9ACTO|nr:aminopeptidase N [Flaviflexus salsibiostraticola]AZN29319.1 aminopeptidase N [Flaviflexus salsibiostraticola]
MSENLTRAEAAARSSIAIDSYRVQLDVRGEETFETISTISFTADMDETFLDFIGAEVSSVVVNGEERDVEWDGARIALTGLAADNLVTVRGRGRYSHSGEGLHRFVDPLDGSVYLYTQYEPADCRRVFANMEQPDLKASFTFEITAPKEWTVLSNREEVESEIVDGGVRHIFASTERISTYLTAIVAGPYHRVTSPQDPRFSVYCRTTLAEHLDHEEIFDISLAGLAAFEQAFDYPYPWGKYDQVFVPEYNLGAMENPGLVTFTESYIFRGQSTRAQHAARANTILHEMSHMWFGDLVTPVWWDDLWLKESFAEYMGSWASVAATEFTEAWATFAARRSAWAFLNDMRPTTHPIVADIVDLEAADQAFDGITYAKGAAALRQLVAYVGEEAFFAGARVFFTRHAFGNASLDDLLSALEETSGRDLRAWAKEWLHTTGASILRVEGSTIIQEGHEPSGAEIRRPHRMSVGAYSRVGGELVLVAEETVELTESVTVSVRGDVIIPNHEAHTYAIVALDEHQTEHLLHCRIADPLARSVVWTGLWEAVRDARLDPARYVEAVGRFHDETDTTLLGQMIRNCEYLVEHYAVDVDTARTVWLGICDDSWRDAIADQEADRIYLWRAALARAGATLPEAEQVLREALDTVRGDRDERWRILIGLASTGSATEAELDAELVNPSEADIVAHMQAVASIPGRRRAAYERALDDSLSNDRISALLAGATARFDGESYPFFEIAGPVWQEHTQEMAERILYALFPEEEAGIADAEAWLEGPGAGAPNALRKIVTDGLDTLRRDRRVRDAFRDTSRFQVGER